VWSFGGSGSRLGWSSAFIENADRSLSRDELLNAAWGIGYQGTTRTLDQHALQLRHKIEPDPSKTSYILTMHGYGYRYCPEA